MKRTMSRKKLNKILDIIHEEIGLDRSILRVTDRYLTLLISNEPFGDSFFSLMITKKNGGYTVSTLYTYRNLVGKIQDVLNKKSFLEKVVYKLKRILPRTHLF